MAREPGVGQRGGQIVFGQKAGLKFASKKIRSVLLIRISYSVELVNERYSNEKKTCNWHHFKMT